MMKSLAIGLALLFALALPATADDSSEANRLAVEAKQLYDRARDTKDTVESIELYRKALANFDRIIAEYPYTDRAVEIVGGEKAAGITRKRLLESIKYAEKAHLEALEEARIRKIHEACFASPTSNCMVQVARDEKRKNRHRSKFHDYLFQREIELIDVDKILDYANLYSSNERYDEDKLK